MRTCQRTFPGLCLQTSFQRFKLTMQQDSDAVLCTVGPFVNHQVLIHFPGSQSWTSAFRLLLLSTLTTHQPARDWRRKCKINLESCNLSNSYSINKGRKITLQDLAQFLLTSKVVVGHMRNIKKVYQSQKQTNKQNKKTQKQKQSKTRLAESHRSFIIFVLCVLKLQ